MSSPGRECRAGRPEGKVRPMSAVAPNLTTGGTIAESTPKHTQLREILRRAVERDLQPGTAIPSEREPVGYYHLSRLTDRSAIDKLAEEGLLSRGAGKKHLHRRPTRRTACRWPSSGAGTTRADTGAVRPWTAPNSGTASVPTMPGKPAGRRRRTGKQQACSGCAPTARCWSSGGSAGRGESLWRIRLPGTRVTSTR